MQDPQSHKMNPRWHHDWENAVGKAPYRYLGCVTLPNAATYGANVQGYNNAVAEASEQARSHGVHLGTCQVCGMGITYNYVGENADGKRFVVGSDCVMKLGDCRFTSEVEEDERSRQRLAAWHRKQEMHRRQQQEREALDRERNGGKTDWELEIERRKAAKAAAAERAAKAATDNAWLIEFLTHIAPLTDFVAAMIERLHSSAVVDLSDRMIEVLRDIYGKAHGRRGSKKYEKAVKEFDAKAGLEESA